MKLRNVSILALAISCCALALPLQDSAAQDGGAPRERERGGRGGRGSMPLPPDWPRAGGFGPNAQGGERPMIEGLVIEGLIPGTFGRRELNDDDLARAVAVAREISPEWGDAIEARIKQDSAQVKLALRTIACSGSLVRRRAPPRRSPRTSLPRSRRSRALRRGRSMPPSRRAGASSMPSRNA